MQPARLSENQRLANNKQITDLFSKALIYALATIGVVIFIAPWVWMLSASFQPLGDIFDWPPNWIPEHFTIDNYTRFFKEADFARLVLNSTIVAGTVTALQLFFNALAAYTFAKRKFPGRDVIFTLLLTALMIPGQVTLIPNYLTLQHVPLFGGNDILGQG